jgi:shikimate kinase
LALIGYRGTGKSTVGRILAERLDRTFVDADLEIASQAGCSIPAIFAAWGEPGFRDREERVLAEITRSHPAAILATGGGAVLREANRRRIAGFGFVVWLRAHPAELSRRLQADRRGLADRPALTLAGTLAEIDQVLEARSPLYRGLADLTIETDGKSPHEIADSILACWAGFQGKEP